MDKCNCGHDCHCDGECKECVNDVCTNCSCKETQPDIPDSFMKENT